MTKEEAARILDPETTIDALIEIEYYGGFNGEKAKRDAVYTACEMAAAALRAQAEAERNEPLTLDELREMDGEPVWIVEYPDWGHWELSEDAEDYLSDRDCDLYGLMHNDPAGRYGLHKLGWLVYRRKPEEARPCLSVDKTVKM